MRTTVATLALLLLALSTAGAQVPRTINYQGRIVDGSTPVNGTRQIDLKLYTSPTGGTPVFTQTQSVEFKDGIFTVAIGAPGGIPESVRFDQPYWLGVTISDFNNGAELSPRFVLRSSPYSFRSVIADSSASAYTASSADSAGTARLLHTPATLQADAANQATLTLANTQGPALRAEGTGRYAIVSQGVDSTSRYFVAGGSVPATEVPPAAGAYYRDNAPMAWALVTSDGTLVNDFGVASVGKPTDQGYEVRLDRPVTTLAFNGVTVPQCIAMVTMGGNIPPTDARLRLVTSWSFKQESDGTLNPQVIMVRFTDVQGTAGQAPFSIVVFGRPQ